MNVQNSLEHFLTLVNWFLINHALKRYLFEAKIAAILIQRSVRAFLLRKWSRAAIKIQALWKRYSARCVFLHQRRLRQSAMGFQGLWRGYHVRTRLCVREKVINYVF